MTRYTIFTCSIILLFVTNCASNKNKKLAEGDVPQIQRPISVGSVLTKLEVVEYQSYNLPENQIRAKVVEVMGYGANTETLKKEAILTLSFAENDTFSSLSGIEEGEIIEALITKSIPSLNSEGNNSMWRIVELKK